jgi:hypothetical protein
MDLFRSVRAMMEAHDITVRLEYERDEWRRRAEEVEAGVVQYKRGIFHKIAIVTVAMVAAFAAGMVQSDYSGGGNASPYSEGARVHRYDSPRRYKNQSKTNVHRQRTR